MINLMNKYILKGNSESEKLVEGLLSQWMTKLKVTIRKILCHVWSI